MSKSVTMAVIVLVCAGRSAGIIDPNFTPKHLTEQADVIFIGPVKPTAKPLQWKLTNASQLKGKSPRGHILSLAKCHKDHVAEVKRALKAAGDRQGILYAGTLKEEKQAFLHLGRTWLALKGAGGGKWQVAGFAPQLSGTYAGATDKLIRMTRYLINDPDGDVPIGAGVRWMDTAKLGKVAGKVADLAAVDFGRGGKRHLFVASTAGDRLFRQKGDEDDLEDVTAKLKLDTKSRRFAWTDVNLDGRADLVSWDGRTVTVRRTGAAGAFAAAGKGWSIGLEIECLGIAPCPVGGKAAVLVSTPGRPVLLKAAAKGWQKSYLPDAKSLAGRLGMASACIVADLDNDGFVDVLQPGAAGAALWKGKAGGFGKPVASAVTAGAGSAVAAVGDFNADGALDIFLGGPEKNTLWENDGKGGFRDRFRGCGSISYKCPAGVGDVEAADLNHDGRPDLCIAYARRDLLYHWSRGYGAFAEEGEVRLSATRVEVGKPSPGQQAVALGDFNNDGSDDLAVILTNGQLYCYFNDNMDMPGVRLRLPKGMAGAVTASCWMGDKHPFCVGTAVVTGHSPAAYVAARYPGKVTVKWRMPGKAPQTKTVKVEDAPLEVILAPARPAKKKTK